MALRTVSHFKWASIQPSLSLTANYFIFSEQQIKNVPKHANKHTNKYNFDSYVMIIYYLRLYHNKNLLDLWAV